MSNIANLTITPGDNALTLDWEILNPAGNSIIIQLGITPEVDWATAPILVSLPSNATTYSLPGNGPHVTGPQLRVVQVQVEDEGAVVALPVGPPIPPTS